jgi:purine nucleosidase
MQDQDQPKAPPAGTPPVAQAGGRRGGVEAPGILFDCDMGRNIDVALALAVLNTLGAKGRLVAVGVSSSSLEAAQFCDAVARFYAGPAPANPAFARPSSPVGVLDDGPKLASAPMLTVPLGMKKPDGSPVFPHGVKSLIDTADARVLFRNTLLGQKDGAATAVLAGPATGFARTLALNGGREAIAAKVGLLVVAAGSFADGPADSRIKADIASARQLFAQWPGAIVAVGAEVGAALAYPGRSIETDFSWTPAHPVVESYRAFRDMPYDAPAQAVAAALYAGNPKEDYFRLSEPGTIEVLDDGRTKFTRSENGKHRHLTIDLAQKDRVLKAFTDAVSAKPAPPMGRGFRG